MGFRFLKAKCVRKLFLNYAQEVFDEMPLRGVSFENMEFEL